MGLMFNWTRPYVCNSKHSNFPEFSFLKRTTFTMTSVTVCCVWLHWRPATILRMTLSPIGPHYFPQPWSTLSHYLQLPQEMVGRDSAVDIATRYELGGPGIECRWGRDFQHSICGMLRGKTGATSSTTNPTRTGPGSNPSLCGEKSAINTMSHGTVFEASNPRE